MKLALGAIREPTDEILIFAKQLGAEYVVFNTPNIPGDGYWDFMTLLQLRTKVESFGLKLGAIENVPLSWYKKVILGLPGRDEQIENYTRTIRNMGKAGIGILGYHWMANSVWRTSRDTPGRGGVKVTSFDYDLVKDAPLTETREYTAEDMWANYKYWVDAVRPVAEQAGVKLALHPDDPPVPSLGGVARIMNSHAGFRRMVEITNSSNFGCDF